MTSVEAAQIVSRYEQLLAAVVGARDLRQFPCPLEVQGDQILACQPDDVHADGSWAPLIIRRQIADLPALPSAAALGAQE